MEETCDEQTDHSKNKLKQAMWELYAANLLNANPIMQHAVNNKLVVK